MTLLRFLPLISLVLAAAPEQPVWQAVLDDGQSVQGNLALSSSKEAGPRGEFRTIAPSNGPRGRDLSLREVRVVRNRAPFLTVAQKSPRLQFQFWGGERVTGELTATDRTPAEAAQKKAATELPILLRNGAQVRPPESALAAIETPRNERVVLYQNFEANADSWTVNGQPAVPDSDEHRSGRRSLPLARNGAGLAFRPSSFPTQARIQWQFFDPPVKRVTGAAGKTESIAPNWSVEFELSAPAKKAPQEFPATTPAAAPENSWIVRTDGQQYVSTAPADLRLVTLPVTRHSGWRQWTLRLTEDRTMLSVDGAVLVVGPALTRGIAAIRWKLLPARGENTTPSTGPLPSLDDFLMLTPQTSPRDATQPRNTQRRELVWMNNGDELFGNVTDISDTGFRFKSGTRSKDISWTSAAALVMPHPSRSRENAVSQSPAIRGWQSWVELSDGQWSHMQRPDRLWLALREVDGQELVAEHPLLGRLHLPLNEIVQIEPQYFGERRLIDPVPWHLGDETRDDFSVPVPVGPKLERVVTFDQLPAGRTFCSFQVEDLEPSGPRTPETSPFLAAVRAGHLQTVLFINDRRIGDLNSYISERARPGQSQRVRVPIPEGVLHTGKNTFLLKQSPAADDPGNFDDFQVSQWAIEWDQGD